MFKDSVLLNDWQVIAAADNVTAGTVQSIRLLEHDLVIWHDGEDFSVGQDQCPHRGAALSRGVVRSGNLICPYHGLAYNRKGNCVRIPAHPHLTPPASASLTTYPIIKRYGLIWTSLGQPKDTLPGFPEWDNPSYRKILCGAYYYRASGFRALENFLDLAHFPFVHEGLLGDVCQSAIADYHVQSTPDEIMINNIRVWQPDPDGTGEGSYVTYTYRILRPLTAHFIKASTQGNLAIFFTVTPVTETECLGWMGLAMNYGFDVPEAELKAFQDNVVAQDIPIVESQRPQLLPLDLQRECHFSSDKASLAYRRWLKQKGVTFGTIP